MMKIETEEFFRRAEQVKARFCEYFGFSPTRLFSAPGAVELVGNHTEHNGGRAIVAALSCDLLAAVGPRTDGIVEVASDAFPPIRFSVYDLGSREREKGKPIALVRGVLGYLAGAYRFGGFSAYTRGHAFKGEAICASGAFETLFAEIVNGLYLGGALPPLVKAYAAQYAENVYFGNASGILRRIGVAFGGACHVDFCGGVKVTPLPLPRAKAVLTVCGGNAAQFSRDGDVRREMGEVAAFFKKKNLCEVGEGAFYENLGALRRQASDRAILRAMHFFEESNRADRVADALARGDETALFREVRESGESALGVLQNCFAPGAIDQPLALAIKAGERLLGEGACRMAGGAAADTALALVREGEERAYGREMARIFGRESVLCCGLRKEGACEVETEG